MAIYTALIPQNTAPVGAKKIGVYNSDGKRLFGIRLGNLAQPKGEKLYSFGAISDVHLQYDTARDDFIKALNYFNENDDIEFICIAGDLTAEGTAEELAEYKTVTETYASKPIYAISGNHDVRNGQGGYIANYTGFPLYYSFEYNGDVFIMVGTRLESKGHLYTVDELQWFYETLEANRNKRCFVFNHVRPQDGCGNALGIYTTDLWEGNESILFEDLMKHYKNATHFHGHSHIKYYLQEQSEIANYDNLFGSHSVHIPSLAAPRDTTSIVNPSMVNVYADSEGCIVDVYKNGIMIRGRDFVREKFIPIAQYWLDTALQIIEPNTFTDSTGTIITQM